MVPSKTLTGCANICMARILTGWMDLWCKGLLPEQTYERPSKPAVRDARFHIFRLPA